MKKKAGPPPQFTLKPVTHCYSACRPHQKLHTIPCVERVEKAQEEWLKAKGDDVEADVPDQEPAGVDFTFQLKQSTLIPPEQVISRFNQRDVVEPFSDEEKLVALRRFREVLDLAKGDLVDEAFEWTMISEALAGHGVADCVRFYYQHKHIIFLKLEKRPDPEQPFVPSRVPECGAELSLEQRRQVGNIIDVDRFENHIAVLQARNTDLRIKNEMLEADAVRMRSSENNQRKRGDEHMRCYTQEHKEVERLTEQLKAFQLQKDRENEDLKKQLKALQSQTNRENRDTEKQLMTENESLKKQLAESKAHAEEQARLVADGKRLSDFQQLCIGNSDDRVKRLEEEMKEVKQQRIGDFERARLPQEHTAHSHSEAVAWRDVG